jgi:hypothetical protein
MNFCDQNSFGARGVITMCEPFDRYRTMMRSFGEYINGTKQNPFTLEYEFEVYKTLLKCCEIIEL